MIKILYKIKPKIVQSEIDDYLGPTIIKEYHMWVPKDYRIVRKKYESLISVRIYTKKRSSPRKNDGDLLQTKIKDFICKPKSMQILKPQYLLRFRSVNVTCFGDFAEGIISELEWDMFHSLPKFTGYFNSIIEFNDFSYFDAIQGKLESEGVKFKGIFIHDIFMFELIRRQIGFRDYKGLEKIAYFLGFNPFKELTHNPSYFPSAADTSYVLKRIPSSYFMDFFHSLVAEALELGIIKSRILLGDGQFIRSNCNNNFKDTAAKKRKQYNDPDAGYCRHNGVRKGVGYDPWCLYAFMGFDRIIPVHFKMFPGNRNDNPAFRETFKEFLQLDIGEWDLIISDSGPYSKESLELCVNNHIFPLIRAKKNLKNFPTKELKKGYWFNMDYIPNGWSDDDVLKVYAIRPGVEKALAPNNTFYNASRMNTRGMESAIKHRVLYYILDLLRALTAFKLGRPDLMSKLSAFTQTRDAFHPGLWVKFAKESGYQTLDYLVNQDRHNSIWG